MTNALPDPKTFESWNDAFQHNISVTRKLEQSLRSYADQNRQKLRSIVGSSYRDLMGTADRIIDMNDQIQSVESNLAIAGKMCSSRSLERVSRNAEKLQQVIASRKRTQTGLASQLHLLQNASAIIFRLIQTNEPTIIIAKLLLFSRLLQKSLSQVEPESRLIESLGKRLNHLRARLLFTIDRHLSNIDLPWKDLVDDMCAFCLTKNATPTDILRHFHSVRQSSIVSFLSGSDQGPVKAVECLINTLRISQVIFPKRLSDSLVRLKDAPLLQNKHIVAIDDLELGLHEVWIPEELRNYAPWPRHDELKELDSKKQIRSWAKQALDSLHAGLSQTLAKESSFQTILNQRVAIFNIIPWTDDHVPGLIVSDVIDDLRDIFNQRFQEIINNNASKIETMASNISTSYELISSEPAKLKSLWDFEILSLSTNKLKDSLARTYNGDDAVSIAFDSSYKSWLNSHNELSSTINSMRSHHWDPDLTEDDVDLDDVDNSRQQLLSFDDPLTLESTVKDSYTSAYQSLLQHLTKLIPIAAQTCMGSTILLRITRGLESSSSLLPWTKITSSSLSSTTLYPLYATLAAHILAVSQPRYNTSLKLLISVEKLPSVILWDGSPPLPITPSPGVFRFLRDVSKEMANIGADVWGNNAVKQLKLVMKKVIYEKIATTAIELINFNTQGEGEGEEEGEEERQQKQQDQQQQQQQQQSEISDNSPQENGSKGNAQTSAEEVIDADTDTNTNTNTNITQTAENSGRPDEDLAADIGDTNSTSVKLDEDSGQQVLAHKLTQLSFDVLYLLMTFGTLNPSLSDMPGPLVEAVALSDGDFDRLVKSAADYWKRTYLLFALLLDHCA